MTPTALAAPPPNDNFGTASPIERVDDLAGTNQLLGDNRDATTEVGEPDHRGSDGSPGGGGTSVWYSWTPAWTESALIGVCTHMSPFIPGAVDFTGLMGVYTGTAVNSLASQGTYSPLDCVGGGAVDIQNHFQAESGTTYHFAISGSSGETGDYVVVLFQAPKNDDFLNATPLIGTQGQKTGDAVNADHQTGEPVHGNGSGASSVWYRWKAPMDGKATFDGCGSEGDAVLAVYRGAALGSLIPVAHHDGLGCTASERVSFTATKDVTYRIVLDTGAGSTGAVTLNYSEVKIPQTTITAGPSGFAKDSTPTFRFTSSVAGSAFQCRFDGHAFGPCSGPTGTHTPASPLADGVHKFEVRALKSGAVDPTPAARSFKLDTHAPQTTITAGPSGVTHDTTPTFKFSSSEAGSTFQCVIRLASGSGTGGPCSGPGATHTPSLPLANGNYVFSVRAQDKAGNGDPTPANRSFTVSR